MAASITNIQRMKGTHEKAIPVSKLNTSKGGKA
jgi:hypothetical protein